MLPVLPAALLSVSAHAVPPSFEAAQASFLRGSCKQVGHVDMMAMGASKPWPDALEAMRGQSPMSSSAILEYFAPLKVWLDEQNKGQSVGWTAQ